MTTQYNYLLSIGICATGQFISESPDPVSPFLQTCLLSPAAAESPESPKKIKYNFKVKAGGKLLNAHFVDTGSPHVVIDINETEGSFNSLDSVPVEVLGREIRYLPEFSPDGTNVNFIEVKDGAVSIRTYERGVEAETLACGTGSVAAALYVLLRKKYLSR